ncbi:hypothetical protein BG011_004253 [Mortierella polycephala]|uniref:L-arabinokinase n=1 Tax=Mortierella polycephala TaxID=41804 RepID=A0A9P6UA00_9FUNG|nr:hypothetical protein BG011_004253 [Mortierella polycephala]
MTVKGYTFCYYVSGHGFGHATRVNQIITELLKSTTTATSQHTIYIVSDAPQFIFQDVIALGAIYRNAKIDAGVVQPLAYSVDRQKTIEGVKNFLSRREEMIQLEVSWLAQVGADCVLADAPFLPCAAASAYGIPACLITNFTFDEVYRFLSEGDDLDEDVIACADAALRDYKKASLLLRLPGSIDIPSFEDEILAMVSSSETSDGSPSISDMDDPDEDVHRMYRISEQAQAPDMDFTAARAHKSSEQNHEQRDSQGTSMSETTPSGVMSPDCMSTAVSSPSPSITNRFLSLSTSSSASSICGSTSSMLSSKLQSLTRKVIDVPLVVRMAVNTREDVLRMLGVDEETIRTKKMALVSFGGQRLKQGWGNPLPEGWIGVICGLPVDHELPEGFYRSPHGVYVPDLTRAADVVIGKLGYGTCSECIAHDTPLIYVSRPQFVEEHGLIKMMLNHGLPVEMTAEEFEDGKWQRSILRADRMAQEEKEGRRRFMESCQVGQSEDTLSSTTSALSIPSSTSPSSSGDRNECVTLGRRSRRSSSVSSLGTFMNPKGSKMMRLSPVEDVLSEREETYVPAVWFERRIPNNGGEVCARHVEEFMAQLEESAEMA